MEEPHRMNTQSERVEQFSQDVAAMPLKSPTSARDKALLRLGAVLIVVGVITSAAAYPLSHGTDRALQQRDAIVQALLGLTITVAGAAVFLRYSLAGFLRFWLARFTYEQQRANEHIAEQFRQATSRR